MENRNEDNCVLNEEELIHIGAAFQHTLNGTTKEYLETAEKILDSGWKKIKKLNDMAKEKKE